MEEKVLETIYNFEFIKFVRAVNGDLLIQVKIKEDSMVVSYAKCNIKLFLNQFKRIKESLITKEQVAEWKLNYNLIIAHINYALSITGGQETYGYIY